MSAEALGDSDCGANTGFDFQKESLDFIFAPRILGFQNGVEKVELLLGHRDYHLGETMCILR